MAGNLAEYPAPPGNKNRTIATLAGPASYTQIGIASPPTGGQVVVASTFGLVDIEFATASVSDNGQYAAHVIFDKNPQGAVQQIRLLWVLAATGAQVAGAVDLSARTVRLTVEGH